MIRLRAHGPPTSTGNPWNDAVSLARIAATPSSASSRRSLRLNRHDATSRARAASTSTLGRRSATHTVLHRNESSPSGRRMLSLVSPRSRRSRSSSPTAAGSMPPLAGSDRRPGRCAGRGRPRPRRCRGEEALAEASTLSPPPDDDLLSLEPESVRPAAAPGREVGAAAPSDSSSNRTASSRTGRLRRRPRRARASRSRARAASAGQRSRIRIETCTAAKQTLLSVAASCSRTRP